MSISLVIQHAMRMRHIMLSAVACVALSNFSTLSHYTARFLEKITENKMCSDFIYKTFLRYFLI